MKKIGIFFIATFYSIIIMAQEPVTAHYYIFIKGNDSANYDIELGKIEFDEKFNPVKVKNDSLTLDNIADELSYQFTEHDAAQFDIFIHGIWAESKLAWKEMIRNAQRDIYYTSAYSRTLQLSIIWDSSISYSKGLKIARAKGDFLSPYFMKILEAQVYTDKINVLCHSMGNRIFQHMIVPHLESQEETLINSYISVAADLETDIFNTGQPLEKISNLVKNSYIYIHNNDRTLKVSKLLNGNKRLGCHGVNDFENVDSSITTIDVTTIKDNEDFPSKMGNHRYFYMSPSVRADLRRLIWGLDFMEGKKKLSVDRRYMLDYKSQ